MVETAPCGAGNILYQSYHDLSNNFLNPRAAKYLFSQDIRFEGKSVAVTQVENFEGVNENDINICFTTTQQLHTDMTTEKENALTYENFAEQQIVLLADEAHHMNVSTKTQTGMTLFESWENTVQHIFKSNDANLLLEFTATHDYETPAMVQKYRNKIIYQYDLINYRNDKFSKEVVLVHSDLVVYSASFCVLNSLIYPPFIPRKRGR